MSVDQFEHGDGVIVTEGEYAGEDGVFQHYLGDRFAVVEIAGECRFIFKNCLRKEEHRQDACGTKSDGSVGSDVSQK